MVLTWKDFSAAPGDNRLIHIVKHGDTKALCGANVDYAIKATGQCPKCRRLRGKAVRTPEGWRDDQGRSRARER